MTTNPRQSGAGPAVVLATNLTDQIRRFLTLVDSMIAGGRQFKEPRRVACIEGDAVRWRCDHSKPTSQVGALFLGSSLLLS